MEKSVKDRIQDLRNRTLECTDCEELVKTRTQVVFGIGNPESKLVFIGEAPGGNEDANGIPFIGRAGKLLDKVLQENDLSRDDIWITNIVKCRPTVKNPSGNLGNRPPKVSEIKTCRKWLDEELSLINPKVIVCVGGPSASVIIHKGFKMTKERGQWFNDSPYAPFAIAVYHPAYVLRLHGSAYDEALDFLKSDIAEAKRKFMEEKDQPKMTLF